MTKSSTSTPKAAEITTETLQKLSFELIAKSMIIWRSLRETGHGKARKFAYAFKIHQMIIDAIRVHPDVQQLKELHEKMTEIEAEYRIARKRGLIGPDGTGLVFDVSTMTEDEQATLARAIVRFEKQSTPGTFDCRPDLTTSSQSNSKEQDKPRRRGDTH